MRLHLASHPGLIVIDLDAPSASGLTPLRHLVWVDPQTGEYCTLDTARDGTIRIDPLTGMAFTVVRRCRFMLDWRQCPTAAEVQS